MKKRMCDMPRIKKGTYFVYDWKLYKVISFGNSRVTGISRKGKKCNVYITNIAPVKNPQKF